MRDPGSDSSVGLQHAPWLGGAVRIALQICNGKALAPCPLSQHYAPPLCFVTFDLNKPTLVC